MFHEYLGELKLSGISMKIIKDDSIKQWALQEIINNWNTERSGIHLSDLLVPRQAYWQKIKPKPPTENEIAYWTSGNAIEDKILRAIGYQKGIQKEWEGISYTPDLFFNFPAEIKSRRSYLAKDGEEEKTYEHYLKQLKGYCALEGTTQGWLIVLSLNEKQDQWRSRPEWAYYRVEFTETEISNMRTYLRNMKDLLQYSIIYKLPQGLPTCPQWMCSREYKKMIKKPFCKTCKKEFQTEFGINKHINGKAGNKHEIEPAVYEIEYENCKWYPECIEVK